MQNAWESNRRIKTRPMRAASMLAAYIGFFMLKSGPETGFFTFRLFYPYADSTLACRNISGISHIILDVFDLARRATASNAVCARITARSICRSATCWKKSKPPSKARKYLHLDPDCVILHAKFDLWRSRCSEDKPNDIQQKTPHPEADPPRGMFLCIEFDDLLHRPL